MRKTVARGDRCGMGDEAEERDACYEGLEKVKACYGAAGGLEGEGVQGKVSYNKSPVCATESAS